MEEKKKESVKDLLFIVIISLVLVFTIRIYIAQPFIVSGASMEPTFHTGEYLIIDQLSYRLNNPSRGDVIVFRYPMMPSKFFIKRIIGLPGETIRIQNDIVSVKEQGAEEFTKIDETYVEIDKYSNFEKTLSNTEYFVMGDNRPASLDSRSWGPLDEKYIVGKALVRLFPINKIDFLPGNE